MWYHWALRGFAAVRPCIISWGEPSQCEWFQGKTFWNTILGEASSHFRLGCGYVSKYSLLQGHILVCVWVWHAAQPLHLVALTNFFTCRRVINCINIRMPKNIVCCKRMVCCGARVANSVCNWSVCRLSHTKKDIKIFFVTREFFYTV